MSDFVSLPRDTKTLEMLTDKQQAAAAKAFANKWEGEHAEEQEGRSFWLDLLQSVFGVEKALEHIHFEKPVRSKSTQSQRPCRDESLRVLR